MPPTECPTEQDWYRRWNAVAVAVAGGVAANSPSTTNAGTTNAGTTNTGAANVQLTVQAGASSDRLCWVFMSGYQAAVRACFPEFAGAGWSCFAAAEPKEGPGCVLAADGEGYRLRGEKSWVAGAACVDRLVVSVGDGEQRRFVCIERDAPGLALSSPRTPSFLAELSQGAAAFDNVGVAASRVLPLPERAHWFRAAEPLFVLLALNGCLAAHAATAGEGGPVQMAATAAIEHGAQLAGHLGERDLMKPGLVELRALTTQTVKRFSAEFLAVANPALQKSWNIDGRLFEMFGLAC